MESACTSGHPCWHICLWLCFKVMAASGLGGVLCFFLTQYLLGCHPGCLATLLQL